ncbi:UNVERIFIED_CONTAM: hypothetical protein K2H54_043210 [Gekko kuhli]
MVLPYGYYKTNVSNFVEPLGSSGISAIATDVHDPDQCSSMCWGTGVEIGPDDCSSEVEDTLVVGPMEDKTMTDPGVTRPLDLQDLSGNLQPVVATGPRAQGAQEQEPATESEIAEGPLKENA